MNTRTFLLLAAFSLFAGTIVGAFTWSAALGIGATFLSFVVLVALYPWLHRRLSSADEGMEAEAKTVASELSRDRTAQAFNPDIDPKSSAALSEEETIALYCRSFDINADKARSLYASGYKRLGDLQEAIPEDLLLVRGINPTVAKRIISTVRSGRA
jgi:predicted DNA-binding helix-hairpin-helix protein